MVNTAVSGLWQLNLKFVNRNLGFLPRVLHFGLGIHLSSEQ